VRNLNSTASFLRSAFVTLRTEAPHVYGRIVAELDATTTNFRVGDEKFLLTVINRDMKISGGRWSRSAKAEGNITLRGVFQLVDGTSTVSILLSSDCLKIKADSDTLLKLDAVIKLFLEASLKSGKLQDHFEEYRRWALTTERAKE
jgi:hypothetical protein